MISRQCLKTREPIIAELQRMVRHTGRADVLSLAQGVVHWGPPREALERARVAMGEASTAKYVNDDGIPSLKEEILRRFVKRTTPVDGTDASPPHVMVTSGANQAFYNTVVACATQGDERGFAAGIFTPFYFNHEMALTLNSVPVVTLPRRSLASLRPDLDAARAAVKRDSRLKLVVVCNPDNPTGSVVESSELEAFSTFCASRGVRLVVDNTYADFYYPSPPSQQQMVTQQRLPPFIRGKHVVNIFSLSKMFGMMGYRVGYSVCDDERLFQEMMKVQDTIAICAPVVSQILAREALAVDRETQFVNTNVMELANKQRKMVREVLGEFFPPENVVGEGGIFFFCRLPSELANHDLSLCRSLISTEGIVVMPGSGCGVPGWIRVCFSNLDVERCGEALERLRRGLRREWQSSRRVA